MAELRGAPKEGMTGTRSTEGVITRSGTGTAQAPKRLTRMLANLLHWLSRFAPGRKRTRNREIPLSRKKGSGIAEFLARGPCQDPGTACYRGGEGIKFVSANPETPKLRNHEIMKPRFPESGYIGLLANSTGGAGPALCLWEHAEPADAGVSFR